MKSRSGWVLGTLIALCLPAASRAAPADALDELAVVLAMIHQDPPAQALDRFRPGLYEKLAAIEADPRRPRIARVRALAFMAREDGARALPRVLAVAGDPEASGRLRIAAAWTLGHPLKRFPQAVDALAGLLQDPDPGLRAEAVRSLSLVGTPRALELLEARRLVERHVVVRRALRAAAARAQGLPLEALPREGRPRAPVLRHHFDLRVPAGKEVR
ncbi:MAG: HEAT repeat domain-containing protein [Deltaproteobacteria bacterium]|nr:MAG: HEAT repeat domain-containing protein [Deltaproteobacteria bacterium]